jgi:hypothetical protein
MSRRARPAAQLARLLHPDKARSALAEEAFKGAARI